ncbi:cytochrome b5 [Leptinotarsa decemlineata]|uniref:cytochrome b5 n=1 Tax=Leptinotarsa decemlineata TaxID=7539 RepID=UPI000C255280|nr:cytochrome b5-like [Leptinotarsa decemlineata]
MTLIQLSTKEIEEHNDDKSTWIVINNKVYDVTAYLKEHPGGEEVLLEHAGKDGSEAFEEADHSSDARELMTKYQIGELNEAERKPIIKRKTISFDSEESSLKIKIISVAVPISLGILAAILYRKYFHS